MYNLTTDQYNTLYLAAYNLRTSVHEKDPCSYWPYEHQLIDYTTILTGACPSNDTIEKAIALAKTFFYDDHREDINKIIEAFIGPFEYETSPLSNEDRKALARKITEQMLSSCQ